MPTAEILLHKTFVTEWTSKGKRTQISFYFSYHPVKIFLLCLLVFGSCHPLKLGQKMGTLLTLDLKFKLS